MRMRPRGGIVWADAALSSKMKPMRAGILIGVIIGAAVVAGAGILSSSLIYPTGPAGAGARLIASNLFEPAGMYHVADLQARPGVAAAIERMKTAGICDFLFKVRTSKMHSNVKSVRLCGEGSVQFDDMELIRDAPRPETRFAVFTDEDGAMYLVAAGRNGSVDADEMERVITTVTDAAIALLPAKLAELAALKVKNAADREAADAAKARAKASFE